MPTPVMNLDLAELLLPALVGLAIGCIFPPAVFIVMWMTGQLGRGEKSIAEQAACLAAKLAGGADANEVEQAEAVELDAEDSRYLGWWTRTGC